MLLLVSIAQKSMHRTPTAKVNLSLFQSLYFYSHICPARISKFSVCCFITIDDLVKIIQEFGSGSYVFAIQQ